LHVMNRDGSNSRVILSDFDRDIQHPLWSKDGSGVFFQYDDRGDTPATITMI
jgi:hypothetical protein